MSYNAEKCVFNDQCKKFVFVLGNEISSDSTAKGLAISNQACVFQNWMALDIFERCLQWTPQMQPQSPHQSPVLRRIVTLLSFPGIPNTYTYTHTHHTQAESLT